MVWVAEIPLVTRSRKLSLKLVYCSRTKGRFVGQVPSFEHTFEHLHQSQSDYHPPAFRLQCDYDHMDVHPRVSLSMERVPGVGPGARTLRPLIRAVRRVAITANCPVCGSADVRRSLRRNFRDIVLACFFLAPFRCRKCRVRFFRVWRPAPKSLPEPPRSGVLILPRQILEIEIAPPERSVPHLVEPPPILVPPERLIRPRSILILESDLAIRKLLRRLLDRRGYFTHEVSGPGDLATELHERRVDLLVVDSALLGADGLEAALALAAVHPNLKILALSLESPDPIGIPARCLALTKPFSLESFLESVDRLLEPAVS